MILSRKRFLKRTFLLFLTGIILLSFQGCSSVFNERPTETINEEKTMENDSYELKTCLAKPYEDMEIYNETTFKNKKNIDKEDVIAVINGQEIKMKKDSPLYLEHTQQMTNRVNGGETFNYKMHTYNIHFDTGFTDVNECNFYSAMYCEVFKELLKMHAEDYGIKTDSAYFKNRMEQKADEYLKFYESNYGPNSKGCSFGVFKDRNDFLDYAEAECIFEDIRTADLLDAVAEANTKGMDPLKKDEYFNRCAGSYFYRWMSEDGNYIDDDKIKAEAEKMRADEN